MKQLRILTGEHAGVHLELTSTRYVVGADDEADIQLLDWKSSPVVIEVEENDMVSIALSPGDLFAVQPDEAERFDDFAPRRVGDIVLCVGPVQGAWPSDLDLIARLSQPAAVPAGVADASVTSPEPRSGKVSWKMSALVGAVMMTAAVGATVASLGHGPHDTVGALEVPLKARVESIVTELPLPGLQVVQGGDQITVRGLIGSSADAGALREKLDGLKSSRIVHGYAVAADVANDIAEGLALPGLQVIWRGEGTFTVAGQTQDVERLRDAVARIRTDLGSLVSRIDIEATEQPRAASSPISAALNAGELQYVQTRDGVKHMSLSAPAAGGTGEQPIEVSR